MVSVMNDLTPIVYYAFVRSLVRNESRQSFHFQTKPSLGRNEIWNPMHRHESIQRIWIESYLSSLRRWRFIYEINL